MNVFQRCFVRCINHYHRKKMYNLSNYFKEVKKPFLKNMIHLFYGFFVNRKSAYNINDASIYFCKVQYNKTGETLPHAEFQLLSIAPTKNHSAQH